MSGSGGGGDYWPPNIDEIPCVNLKFTTQISSPQSPAIQSVRVGDVLVVQIQALGGIQAVAILKNGQVVGGLVGGKVKRLRDCLVQGSQFKATVLTVNGAQVQVEVEHI
jgi:hypothetical protein